ncbi:MAG: hypothetical protein O9312_10820 [Hylemonella sp.]|nr:hypothetical protein [Hylemonella sp.]
MKLDSARLDASQFDLLLRRVREDVGALSLATVPLVGALVSGEPALPVWFRDWLLGELGQRVPLDVVSPAAEAVMRLREFGRYAMMDFALQEIEAQYALLQALGQVDEMYRAVDFMTQLSERIAHIATGDASDPTN